MLHITMRNKGMDWERRNIDIMILLCFQCHALLVPTIQPHLVNVCYVRRVAGSTWRGRSHVHPAIMPPPLHPVLIPMICVSIESSNDSSSAKTFIISLQIQV